MAEWNGGRQNHHRPRGRGRGAQFRDNGPHAVGERRRSHGPGHPNSQRRDENRSHAMGTQLLSVEELETLSQSSPDDVLLTVTENEGKFLNSYKKRHFCNHPKHMKTLIKLLSKLVECEDKSTASRILAQILSADGDYALLTTKIDILLKGMAYEQRDYVRRENLFFLENLINIGTMAIKTIPTTVVCTFPIIVMENTIQELKVSGENTDLIDIKFEEMKPAFKEVKQLALRASMKKRQGEMEGEEKEPPESFKELSILPTPEEMCVDSKAVFLRGNKVKGSYNDWDHYFDVQFRLLREDFVRPLREGVGAFTQTGSERNVSDIRVYKGAKILNPVCLFTGIGFQLRFDASKFTHVNWEHSRCLIFGSLLCLSNDNFDKCFLFATVVKRDPKDLKEGRLIIKFESNVNAFQIDPKESYEMVESTAYYEAYRHVLKSMQDISESPDTVPLEKYVVKCDFTDVKTPVFLQIPSRLPRFNMADIFTPQSARGVLKIFDVTNQSVWPLADRTHFDASQLDALKMALSKEVSVIQGPPGTGKTYIGLKIVEAYLKNRAVWDPQRAAPILVVCYTNHALDQFLEGIHDLQVDGKCPNIIRVGGRCKSKNLEDCILKEKVQECRSNRSIPRGLFRDYMDARSAVFEGQNFIKSNIANSDAEAKQKVLRLSDLQELLLPRHYDQLKYADESAMGKEMELWLELWYPEEDFQLPSPTAVLAQPPPLPVPQHEESTSSDDEGLIQVDNEARVLQEERMIEGEELEVPFQQQAQQNTAKPKQVKKKDGWKTVQLSDAKKKKKITKGFQNSPMSSREERRVGNIWELTIKQKWQLYLYWNNKYIKLCKDRIHTRADEYNTACEGYGEKQRAIDCHVAQGADVVGMTTTGAAKYHHLLKHIRPKIVIFEEAAEVLEAHIITSLTSSVQQLIMIGDHKQLKPKPTCYDLEKNYHLDVSLFERLINNNFHYVTLEIQHRMRPEISKLIHPTIYEKLQDAEKVHEYPHVKGVGKDVFFIDHVVPEEHSEFNDMKSHVNKFEAEYIVELCHYLLKQGYYSPCDITILTMYRGQLLEFKNRMKREHFDGVRVAAVDDFQGEENEIILLSLVRSNSEGSIGFLNIENRVCVSLSRAKQGLYVIGNFEMLREKVDTKWPEIIHHMEKETCVGRGLPLYCQVHSDSKVLASVPNDFRKRPEGGCTKVCAARLDCGHSCKRICHPRDREHKLVTCSEKCSKPLPCGHNCKAKCYECKKNKQCVPCSAHVPRVLPQCGHTVTLRCSENPVTAKCSLPCSRALTCGHKCPNTCSAPCTTRCTIKIEKHLPCGHKVYVLCFEDPSTVLCPVQCEEMLECGDKCSGTCGKCQRGRLHVKCQQKCGRDLVCGHNCKFRCPSICPPCEEPCNNYCFHSKCPKKCYEPCSPCMEPCTWRCPHFLCTKPCGELCNRPPCNQPCVKTLKCGHPCIGLCGEPCPKKCRVCHHDEVCEVFFGTEDEDDARFIELQDCKHIVEVGGLDQWIETEAASTSTQVQFKTCPKCKTSIRKSVRYGNTIKRVLGDMEAIKQKERSAAADLSAKYQQAKDEMSDMEDNFFVKEDFERVANSIYSQRTTANWYRSKSLEFQLLVLPKLQKLYKIATVTLKPFPGGVKTPRCTLTPSYVMECLINLKKFSISVTLSKQQIADSTSELRRLSCLSKLLELQCKIHVKKTSILPAEYDSIVKTLERLYCRGWKLRKTTEEHESAINQLIKAISTKYQVDGLSEEELMTIVSAVGLSQGHWFKCPKGHYYCIGECGGAVQESKCPECGSTIGGQSHALAAGNVHAGEMDGSRHAAWSEGANMDNFDPQELARLQL